MTPRLLATVDLAADEKACWIIKDERVAVEFAVSSGALKSAVGMNHYQAGDALISGLGDRWCVSRARFDAKHRPESPTQAGEAGFYRNIPTPIRGKSMNEPFRVPRCLGGDVLNGEAGDWLVEYAPGDHGIVSLARFTAVYRILS